jgi:hypothetical protein
MCRIQAVTAVGTHSDRELNLDASRVWEALGEIEEYVRREDFHGYDPYDALLSPIFRLPLLRSSHYTRLVAQQLLKRLPANPRPLLGIKKHESAVTYARMLEGYAHLSALGRNQRGHYDEPIHLCLRRLSELRSRGYSGDCWGYEFDWEPRYADMPIPAGVPNIVATGIVTNALFETYRLTGIRTALEACVSATEFVLRDLTRTPGPDETFCWGYFPHDRQLVLNATMKGARLSAQVFSLTDNAELLEAAQRTVKFVVAHQRADGAWPYSVGDPRSWVDNFHTGYLLDCLAAYEHYAGDDTFSAAKVAGWRYYRSHFLTQDCAPKHFDRALHPIDSTACAQAITTLCTFDDVPAAAGAAMWTLTNMRRRDGGFSYQRHARYTNRISYMRWSVAPMFCALSRLLYAIDRSPRPAASVPSRDEV